MQWSTGGRLFQQFLAIAGSQQMALYATTEDGSQYQKGLEVWLLVDGISASVAVVAAVLLSVGQGLHDEGLTVQGQKSGQQ